jgi:hypothetical protein
MRIMTIAMFAVLCFAFVVPMALQRHAPGLAIGISILFAVYLAAQVFLWRRMRPRA